MFDELEAAGGEWTTELRALEPGGMIGKQPAAALAIIRKVERATAAARLALLERAEEMHPWQREGFGSFEDWLAAQEGTSKGQAKRNTRSAKKLNKSRRTAKALEDGEISEDEAEVIADAADKNPEAESGLLDTAKNKGRSHLDLKDEAAKAKASGESDDARARRLREGRSAGWGTDRDGFWTVFAKLQPHIGAEIQRRLEAATDRQLAMARQDGRREPHDHYRADALTALLLGRDPVTASSADTSAAGRSTTGPGEPSRAESTSRRTTRDTGTQDGAETERAETGGPCESTSNDEPVGPLDGPAAPTTNVHKHLVLDIDFRAMRRGRTLSGETCSIRGVGPVPVEIAREWFDGDAFIKAVIRDGTDVRTIAHFGRKPPAKLRTALGIVDHQCAVPGCNNRRIEYDHDQRHADHGPCSFDNLRPLCVAHHRQRTHHGYELRGPPGDRTWHGSDGTILFADDPQRLPAEPALF